MSEEILTGSGVQDLLSSLQNAQDRLAAFEQSLREARSGSSTTRPLDLRQILEALQRISLEEEQAGYFDRLLEEVARLGQGAFLFLTDGTAWSVYRGEGVSEDIWKHLKVQSQEDPVVQAASRREILIVELSRPTPEWLRNFDSECDALFVPVLFGQEAAAVLVALVKDRTLCDSIELLTKITLLLIQNQHLATATGRAVRDEPLWPHLQLEKPVPVEDFPEEAPQDPEVEAAAAGTAIPEDTEEDISAEMQTEVEDAIHAEPSSESEESHEIEVAGIARGEEEDRREEEDHVEEDHVEEDHVEEERAEEDREEAAETEEEHWQKDESEGESVSIILETEEETLREDDSEEQEEERYEEDSEKQEGEIEEIEEIDSIDLEITGEEEDSEGEIYEIGALSDLDPSELGLSEEEFSELMGQASRKWEPDSEEESEVSIEEETQEAEELARAYEAETELGEEESFQESSGETFLEDREDAEIETTLDESVEAEVVDQEEHLVQESEEDGREREEDEKTEEDQKSQELHEEAKRFARLLIAEIKLYNEEAVKEGRREQDLYSRLQEDIVRSRQMYEKRVDDSVKESNDYFHEELVRVITDDNAKLLGEDYPGAQLKQTDQA